MSTPSPYAFTVGGEVFFCPHTGPGCWCGHPECSSTQRDALLKIADRVMRGRGPSKFFLRGNRGGGKSLLVRRGACHALAMALPKFKYVVVRRNYPDLESNHLIHVGPEMRRLGGTFNETKRIAAYPNGSIGFYRQCEEFADVEKIVGAEMALLFVDEAPQIAWDNLALMLPSIRVAKDERGVQPYYGAAVFSGNPTGESIDELDKRFVEQDVSPVEDPLYDPSDWCHVPIHLKDNPSVDKEEYIKSLGPIPPAFRAAWIDGVRMDARTLFTVHKTIDEKVLTHRGSEKRPEPLPEEMLGRPYHYIQELPKVSGVPLLRVPWIQVYRTYDHGFYPDPAVCIWLAVLGRRIIAFHEETWFSTIVKDLAAKILETTRELVGETPVVTTLADPTIDVQDGRVTVMDIFEIEGVPMEPSINDRAKFADAIHNLLGEEVEPGVPRFQIYEPGCPLLAKYLPKYRWDEKDPRKFADHQFDHYGVALAYFGISSGVLSITQAEPERNPRQEMIREALAEAQRYSKGRRYH